MTRSRQKSTNPRLILMASSTRRMLWPESLPSFFAKRCRSTERSWFTMTADGFDSPLSRGSMTTSLGNGGLENCVLMAATIVMGLY